MNDLSQDFVYKRADQLLTKGYHAVEDKCFEDALDQFRASAYVMPSSEAYTNWGWMEHQLGDTERAIELCREAITLDPDFGSPYNDIGSYLVSLGKVEESIEWFERAIASKVYMPRQYPHINLGKVYLSEDDYEKALDHFEKAYHICADEDVATIIASLRDRLKCEERPLKQ